jgi:hypothetical protein
MSATDLPPPEGAGDDDELELYEKIVSATNQLKKLVIEKLDTAVAEGQLEELKAQYKTVAGREFVLADRKKKKTKKTKGGDAAAATAAGTEGGAEGAEEGGGGGAAPGEVS